MVMNSTYAPLAPVSGLRSCGSQSRASSTGRDRLYVLLDGLYVHGAGKYGKVCLEPTRKHPPRISMIQDLAKEDKPDCMHISVELPRAVAVNLSKIEADQSPKLTHSLLLCYSCYCHMHCPLAYLKSKMNIIHSL